MENVKSHRGKLARKVMLLVGLLSAVPLIALTLLLTWRSSKSVMEMMNEKLESQSMTLQQLCQSQDDLMNAKLNAHMLLFHRLFKEHGYIIPATGADNSAVDEVIRQTGSWATIFRMEDGSLLRVATSVVGADGKRAVGTRIESDSPVYQKMVRGEVYSGLATILGGTSYTRYEPIIRNGRTIGVLFVGFPFKDFGDLKAQFKELQVNSGYYCWAMDGKQRIMLHPTLDMGYDLSSFNFAKDILNQKNGLIRYFWEGKWTVASFRYFEPWGWYVVMREDEEQALAPIHTTLWVAVVTLALFLVLALVAGYFGVNNLTHPIVTAADMVKEMSMGRLGRRIGRYSSDEVGDMSRAMDLFADRLQNDVVGTMKRIADGDLSAQISVEDRQDEINPALKQTIDSLKGLVEEANLLTKAAIGGKLSTRGNASAFKGAYRDIVEGINSTLDAVMGPINEAAEVLEKVAARDLTARVRGDYKGDHAKIKDSLNQAVENLDKGLAQVAIGADQVASATVQISTGSQSLSQGTSEQASSLEEVSSSLQEMTSMTKQNAANAKEARAVAEQAKGASDKGTESMARLSEAMNRIKASSDSTAKIVKTIDQIAFQTNLLALNAAVEAARAGEAGKGFAVVAAEVRNLAMRSAESAKNTSNLIEDAVRNSQNGVAINEEVLKNFREINERANKVSEVMAEIAAASDQQNEGLDQINKAMEQMNQVTQQGAANAEESASAAEELSSQAEEMRSMVAGFKLSKQDSAPAAILHKTLDFSHTGAKSVPGNGGGAAAKKLIPLEDKDRNLLKHF